ncbi:hypothetical protein BKA61DRAFT_739150 [Leptodontidium sp. MPI-SDFR-AT-0119]|nr:hypothetical protein BKA61DRAFT_739150 [Leptodontidium sp. MPI-SDFR-AT-0119]
MATMSAVAAQPLNLVIPTSAPKPIQRIPVARKAVPTRKPVGQGTASPTTQVPATKPVATSPPSAAVNNETKTKSLVLIQSVAPTQNVVPRSEFPFGNPATQNTDELPPGWTSAFDPDGRIFYMNHTTRTSSWSRPEIKPSVLPPGWEERTTPDGKVYYFNSVNQLTTWERPSASLPGPAYLPEISPKSIQPVVLERQLSSASSDSTFEQQPISPLSPGIEWETPEYSSRSSRRRSNFSLSSLSSASSKTMSRMKLPPSASSNAMVKGTVKGTKSAAKLGLKGAKITGRAIKDNRKVIGLTLKVANLVLKNTTGIDMGGLEGMLEGGGGGVEDLGGCEDFEGGEDGEGDGEVEEEGDEEVVVEFGSVDYVAEEVTCFDGAVVEDPGCQDLQSSEVVTETTQSTTVTEETYTAEAVQIESTDTGCVAEDAATQETVTEQVVFDEQTTFQETVVMEELTVEQQAAYSGAFSGESMWVQEDMVQDTIFQETSIEQTTTIQETTIQETTVVETGTSCNGAQEETITVVTTEVDCVEVTTTTETMTETVVVDSPPVQPPINEPVAPVIMPPPPPEPMEPFVFAPILAGPMMVEPPAESNGVIFAPTYV